MNELEKKYSKEIEKILAKYPPEQKRSAVMPLLYLAQKEKGYIGNHDIEDIAAIVEIAATEVATLIGFYTLYHDQPEGNIRIQVCTDLPCALRGADEFLAQLCDALGIAVGETTADGMVTVEEVMCLAACDRAPMFQSQSSQGIRYHEDQTVESALQVIEQLKKEAGK